MKLPGITQRNGVVIEITLLFGVSFCCVTLGYSDRLRVYRVATWNPYLQTYSDSLDVPNRGVN